MPNARIYLDNAATSWPKPVTVYQAVDRYQRDNGASAGRGSYASAIQARQIVDRTRSQLQRLFTAPTESLVVFGLNGTDAINTCLHGYLRSRCHVVTSDIEHNSVLRPLSALSEQVGIEVSYAPCNLDGIVTVDAIRNLLRADTRLVVLSHVSNVTGVIQPIEAIGELLRERRIRFLVDAAQSAGYLSLNLKELPVDMLATSGHKGLLGPLGTGVSYLAPGMEVEVASTRQGGTGTSSDLDRHPDSGIDKYEAGNLPMPAIAGLEAGVDYVLEQADAIHRHKVQLIVRLIDRLNAIRKVRILGSREASVRVGVVSFVVDGFDCHEVAAILETAHGIQVRSGLMCAPRIHAALSAPNGSVRVSLGPFNTVDDIDALSDGIEEL